MFQLNTVGREKLYLYNCRANIQLYSKYTPKLIEIDVYLGRAMEEQTQTVLHKHHIQLNGYTLMAHRTNVSRLFNNYCDIL